MSRYFAIETSVWTRPEFRALTRPKPNAQTLYVYLRACPQPCSFPGLIRAGAGAIGDELGWPPAAVTKHLRELAEAGLIEFDPAALVVWLPEMMDGNRPRNENQFAGWAKWHREIPECELKQRATDRLRLFCNQWGKQFPNWFENQFGNQFRNQIENKVPDPTPTPTPTPPPTPEQQQLPRAQSESSTSTARAPSQPRAADPAPPPSPPAEPDPPPGSGLSPADLAALRAANRRAEGKRRPPARGSSRTPSDSVRSDPFVGTYGPGESPGQVPPPPRFGVAGGEP